MSLFSAEKTHSALSMMSSRGIFMKIELTQQWLENSLLI